MHSHHRTPRKAGFVLAATSITAAATDSTVPPVSTMVPPVNTTVAPKNITIVTTTVIFAVPRHTPVMNDHGHHGSKFNRKIQVATPVFVSFICAFPPFPALSRPLWARRERVMMMMN